MQTLRLLPIPALLLLAAACADDSPSSGGETDDAKSPSESLSAPAPTPTSTPYDAQPYCDITRQLEKAGEETFATLDRSSTRAAYEATERSFVVDNGDLLDDLLSAAPAHLSAEVETFLAAMRQRGGLGDGGVAQREASSAEKAMIAWEKKHC